MKQNLTVIFFTLFLLDSFPQQIGWEKVSSGTIHNLNSIHSYNNFSFACGDSGIIIKSTDNGLTWQSLPILTTKNLNDVFLFNENGALVVGDSGTILFTSDGGSSWFTNPFTSQNFLSISFFGNRGLVGTDSVVLIGFYNITSINFVQTQFFPGNDFFGVSMITSEMGFGSGVNSIFHTVLARTSNSGIHWDFTSFYLTDNETSTGLDFVDSMRGFLSSKLLDGRGAISKTTNSGNTWTSTIFNVPILSINFPENNNSQIGFAVGDSGRILKTTDEGDNWILQNSGVSARLNKVHFKDTQTGFAVGDSGIILKTIDGGLPVELASFSVESIGQDVNLNWITSTEINNKGFEVERSRNPENKDKTDWDKIVFIEGKGTTTEQQKYSFTDKNLSPDKYRYRLKQVDFDGKFEYSNIKEVEVGIPGEYYLSQNFPNPFNPITIIKYTIPSKSTNQLVVLKIFNVLGGKVSTLVNEEKLAGIYSVTFDGSVLPSGIYFYRLTSGGFNETRKMTLLK